MSTPALSAEDFPNGVERYKVGTDDEGEQCARCGSSVTWEESDTLDLGHLTWPICLSSVEWCDAHPMHGREQVIGAGRAARLGDSDG